MSSPDMGNRSYRRGKSIPVCRLSFTAIATSPVRLKSQQEPKVTFTMLLLASHLLLPAVTPVANA